MMRKHLTIGELSNLLGISAHSIRYYEKEGLIKPSNVSEGGYRLYDYDDVYLLSGIMLLRNSEIPIKQIKQMFTGGYDKDSYMDMLRQSYQRTTAQIEKLETIRERVRGQIEQLEKANLKEPVFSYHDFPERKLRIVMRSSFDMNYAIKQIYDVFMQKNIDMSRFYQDDEFYYVTENDISYCILDHDEQYDLEAVTCKAGSYLCYTYREDDTADTTEKRIEEFFAYIKENRLRYEGDMLLIISVQSSMADETGYVAELQMRIV